jgi:hypothetical protein
LVFFKIYCKNPRFIKFKVQIVALGHVDFRKF